MPSRRATRGSIFISKANVYRGRGKIRVTTYNDDGSVIDSVVLCQDDGIFGVDIPKNVWHTLEALEPNSCIFECKKGPFVPHEVEGVLVV